MPELAAELQAPEQVHWPPLQQDRLVRSDDEHVQIKSLQTQADWHMSWHSSL